MTGQAVLGSHAQQSSFWGVLQELRVFLEAEGALGLSMDWQQLHPMQGSFLDGAVRLPKQLIGTQTLTPKPKPLKLHPLLSLHNPFPDKTNIMRS